MICSVFFLVVTLVTTPISSQSNTSSFKNKTELQQIDAEIESLEHELSSMRKEALNHEVEAQRYMIDNWHEFAEDIKKNEENEKAILVLKKKIKKLNERKNSLIKHL